MNFHFSINKMLARNLAFMVKHSEETLHRNNTCILALKNTIVESNRNNLLAIKAHLLAFTNREAERDFHNGLIELYLKLIEQHLRKKPIN